MAWFREYTTPDDPDTLGPEGMEKFCEDIGVEPENVVMLVLAYRMQARQMGFFTQEEWIRGLAEMQCDSIQKLQNRLDYLRCLLNDQNIFKAIYRYAYDFARVSYILRLMPFKRRKYTMWLCSLRAETVCSCSFVEKINLKHFARYIVYQFLKL